MKKNLRNDFPFFTQYPELIYFDNAATSQKPKQVLEAVKQFYEEENANPLRGVYSLSVKATEALEGARKKVARFLGAEHSSEIIFTRNATESLNLIAYSYALANLKAGDEIVLTIAEHHSNILPWQMVAEKTGAKLVFLYLDKKGKLLENEIEEKIGSATKLVAVCHISNVLGVKNPVEKVIKKAHTVGAVVVVDGAQSAPHTRVQVKEMDADFFVCSGHKMLAPTGIGVLYGKKSLLESMSPFLRGGEMIEYVEEHTAMFAELPYKFEAGTTNVGGAVGLAAAIDYMEEIGLSYIEERELLLTKRLLEGMKTLPFVHIIGSDQAEEHHGIVTFTMEDVHPHDVASILDDAGVCVRAGHHCAQPLGKFLGQISTDRASLSFYNTEEEVDRFLESLTKVRGWLGFGS